MRKLLGLGTPRHRRSALAADSRSLASRGQAPPTSGGVQGMSPLGSLMSQVF